MKPNSELLKLSAIEKCLLGLGFRVSDPFEVTADVALFSTHVQFIESSVEHVISPTDDLYTHSPHVHALAHTHT